MSSSLTPTISLNYIPPSSCQTELKITLHRRSSRNHQTQSNMPGDQKFVTHSTTEPAKWPILIANTDMPAKIVKNQDMERKIVREGANEYLRHNLWQNSSSLSPTTAEWSMYARPLPCPPLSETLNPIVRKTLADHPDLFQIVMPINVNVFECLLANHPNQPFVHSVCLGLREGFWPWADTLRDDLPYTHDESQPPPSDPIQASFIQTQCEMEPNSTNLRLVTDHSAGQFSLNNMIDHTLVTGFPLDNLQHLSEILDVRRSIGNVPITMWKSDISKAYHLLPVHPAWQIKQINTVNGLHYVDRNLAFGSSASPGIFISFNSLIAWIAKYEKLFDYLANYVDDSSGCDLDGNTLLYEPYQCYLPAHQKQLLDLWDELGIPHKCHKQVSGCPLTIIGIDVGYPPPRSV
ncbi:hypothetical protein BYT27DRAFT_7222352 [Phlegmacium glaucopus]|nr:hypothetical protein BYT27DRAFT_7222352 [Phlegmacium glaucopus]